MDIRNYDVARKLIRDINSAQVETRREAEYKAYKVCEGAQKEYVVDELKRLFPESYTTMRVSDVSLANKVITKVSKAYKEAPVRELGECIDRYEELLDQGNFDSVMSEFDRDFNRQKYGVLWVNRVDGVFSFHSLKGFEVFVVRNRVSGSLEAVVINYPSTNITHSGESSADGREQIIAENQDDTSAESEVYAMWTKDHHALWVFNKKNKGIDGISIDGNEEGINPLGMLPFVFVSKSSSIDLPFLNQLTDQSINYNVLSSDLYTACALQGYSQLVMKLPQEIKFDRVHSGMTTVITLPIIEGATAQPDAQYISPAPDLGGMRDAIGAYVQSVLDEHGISSLGAVSYSSGLERLIAQADVSDVITSNQKIYAHVEQGVLNIMRAYLELENDRSLECEDELNVIFQKSKVLISDGEVLDNIQKRLDMGLITKREALQIIDPNLGDSAAEEKLIDIEREKSMGLAQLLEGLDADKQETSNEETEII